jgi:hypothetical protein
MTTEDLKEKQEHKHSLEKREHKRYNINSGAFALLKTNELEILGSIKDISTGGLCLSHIDENKKLNGSKITINLICDDNCFEDFIGRNIWNVEEDGGFMAAMVKMRRRGLKFEHLSPDKELELQKFIDALVE